MKSRNSKTGRKPLLYVQMAEKVMDEIRKRNLQPHDPVPSEGELAKLYAVSRMTAKLALQILVKEGVVYRLERRGTFLSADFVQENAKELVFQPAAAPQKQAKRRIAWYFRIWMTIPRELSLLRSRKRENQIVICSFASRLTMKMRASASRSCTMTR